MATIRQLRYFESLARHRHFGRAARECAVTQPALSMQIQELEAELELQLVERRRGGVLLTPGGEKILDHTRSVLSSMDNIRTFAQGSTGLEGKLRLGIIPTIAPYLLPVLLPELSQRWPQLQPTIRETQTSALLDELQDGRIDLVVAALPIAKTTFETLPLFDDRFLLAVSQQHPVPKKGELSQFISQSQLLLLEEGHCLRDQVLNHCNLSGIRHGEILGTSNIATLIQLVANGLGITIVPELSVRVEGERKGIRFIRFGEPQPYRTLALVWRKGSAQEENFLAIGKLLEGSKRLLKRPRPVL